jgi:hypothetical protein
MIRIKVTYDTGTTRIFSARKFSSGLMAIAKEVAGTGATKCEVMPEKKKAI